MSEKLDEAKQKLKHYIGLSLKGHKMPFGDTNEREIESIVDCIVEAAEDRVFKALEQRFDEADVKR